MALYTLKEFAEKCGIKSSQLSIYRSRGKIAYDSKHIDSETPLNKQFLEEQQLKNSSKQEEAEVITRIAKVGKYKDPGTNDVAASLPNVPTFKQSTELLKHLDTQKREQEVEALKIKIAKARGEVVPTELVIPVLVQQNQAMMVEMKNGMEEILRLIAKKHDISLNEVAEYRKMITYAINDSSKRATDHTKKAVINIVHDYSDKKGVGEKA